MIIADVPTAVIFTVTTLVIACPHALGLAIPLVTARSTSLGQSGIISERPGRFGVDYKRRCYGFR